MLLNLSKYFRSNNYIIIDFNQAKSIYVLYFTFDV